MATQPQNLEAIIKSVLPAASDVVEEVAPAVTEETTVETEEETEEETTETVDEYGLNAVDITQAKQLLAALRDPTKAPAVIEFLTNAAKPTTNKEAAVIAKGLTEELAESLGPELKYLADKIGPIFEKRLKDMVESSEKKVSQRVDEIELAKHTEAAEVAQIEIGKKFFADGKIPDALEKEIGTLFEQIPARKGQKMADYLQDLLFVAAGRKGIALKAISTSSGLKIERNRTDASIRLASEGNRQPVPGETVVNPKRQMTIGDAVSLALEKTKADFEKS